MKPRISRQFRVSNAGISILHQIARPPPIPSFLQIPLECPHGSPDREDELSFEGKLPPGCSAPRATDDIARIIQGVGCPSRSLPTTQHTGTLPKDALGYFPSPNDLECMSISTVWAYGPPVRTTREEEGHPTQGRSKGAFEEGAEEVGLGHHQAPDVECMAQE